MQGDVVVCLAAVLVDIVKDAVHVAAGEVGWHLDGEVVELGSAATAPIACSPGCVERHGIAPVFGHKVFAQGKIPLEEVSVVIVPAVDNYYFPISV